MADRQSLTRADLDRLKVQSQAETMLLGCHVHPAAGNTAIYDEGHLRLLCRDCGFEAARIKVATDRPEQGSDEVRISLDPACIEAENVREFHPEAVGAATGALRTLLQPDRDERAHRDADILASCAVSEALKALVTVAGLDQPDQSKEEKGLS
jgi:hypothetical protein